MEPESKKLLEETYRLAEENNTLLKKMRHAQRIASFARSVYWVIVIGLGIGAFYFVQPYFDKLTSFFQDTSASINNFKRSF